MSVHLPTRFRLIRELGTGRSATVWLARDTRAGRDVALKILDIVEDAGRPDLAGIVGRRFEAELRSLGRLRGVDGVCQLLGAGTDRRGAPWLALEYLPGPTLAQWAAAQMPPLGQDSCRSLFAALAAAHERAVAHGDISPGNIILNDRGAPVLTDFGMCELIDPVRSTDPVGLTPAYAAPERIRGGRPTPPSDVYALATTLLGVVEDDAYRLRALLERARVADPRGRPSAARLARALR